MTDIAEELRRIVIAVRNEPIPLLSQLSPGELVETLVRERDQLRIIMLLAMTGGFMFDLNSVPLPEASPSPVPPVAVVVEG